MNNSKEKLLESDAPGDEIEDSLDGVQFEEPLTKENNKPQKVLIVDDDWFMHENMPMIINQGTNTRQKDIIAVQSGFEAVESIRGKMQAFEE